MRNLLITMMLFAANLVMAQDIIVKKDGSTLNVYNLEESSTSFFYTLEPSAEASVLKISRDEVFSFKKQGGEMQAVTSAAATATPAAPAAAATTPAAANTPAQREPVTAKLSSSIRTEKGRRCFSAYTPDGHELNYRIISEADCTVEVTKGEYHASEYVIPEYIDVEGKNYTVTEIGKQAFLRERTVRRVQFPTTLKRIGESAFTYANLDRIDLPEGLEELDNAAFYAMGFRVTSPVIYLPSSVKKIGRNCFLGCGSNTSYRGFCQETFTNMPDYINEGNCKNYGIDEEAVEAYYRRKALSK